MARFQDDKSESSNFSHALIWAASLLLAGLLPTAQAAQQVTTRVVEFSYNANTGQVELERVDPGLGTCAETVTSHDAYGNKKRVVVQPCASTSDAAKFTPRLTLNEFAAQAKTANLPSHPAGAYLTRTRTGTLAMEAQTSPEPAASETTAVFHSGFGAAVTQTGVAHQDSSRNIATRAEFDGLGRVRRAYAPVHRTDAGVTSESYAESKRVYCRGNLANPDPNVNLANGCIVYRPKVPVQYTSGMLFDSTGSPNSNLEASAISAYFIETEPKSTTGAKAGARSRVHYDSLHREIAKETETYGGQWSMTLTVYDRVGNPAASWSGFYGRRADGVFVAPPAELRQRTAARDLLHRSVDQRQYWRAKAGDSAVELSTQFTHDGLQSTVTAPADATPDGVARSSIAIKNGAGQVAQTIDAYGATLNSAYDSQGNLLRTVDALGNQTSITYTGTTARFKVKMNDPDQGEWSYGYDALGQLVSQTDDKAQTTSMGYDVLGRMVTRNNASLNGAWFFGKDAAGAWCAGGLPRLCESRSGNAPNFVSRTRIGYDKLGRAQTTTDTLAGRDFVSSTTFDTEGRVQNLKYPSGFTLQHAYSSGAAVPGVLQKVYDASNSARVFWSIANITAADVFDAKGNVVRSELGNGLGTNHLFDPISGKALKLRTGLAGGGYISALDHDYTFDKANAVAQRRENHRGTVESFLHDKLNRLVSYTIDSSSDVQANRTVTVDYNAIGNILYKSDVGGYTYHSSDKPHAVRSAGGTNYTYDGNGLLGTTSGFQTRSNTWTAFNHPKSLQHNGRSVQFTYDEDYKRVSETITNGATVRELVMIHPDNAGGLGFEREITTVGGGRQRNENRHYVSVGGSVVAVVKTLTPVGNDPVSGVINGTVSSAPGDANLVVYWHKDALGSIVAVSNRDGAVMERMAFDPWGRRLRDTGVVDPYANPAHGDRGFTGHEHLDETGYVHMNGRIFDPFLGRFLSADPIIQFADNLQSYNRFSYVLNSPLASADPSGHVVPAVAWAAMWVAGYIMSQEGNQYWSIVGRLAMMYAGGQLVSVGLGVELGPVTNTFNVGGYGNSFLAAATTSLAVTGGNVEQAMMDGAFAMAFTGAGQLQGAGGALTPQQLFAHVLIGCVQSAAGGGKCGPGAMSAGFGKVMTAGIPNNVNPAARGIMTVVAGGTASVIGGGKFANGALQAGIGYLFNYCTSASAKCLGAWANNIGKIGLGGLGMFGGSALCTTGVGCVLGAVGVITGAANVYEGTDWLINRDENTNGVNPIKQALTTAVPSANADLAFASMEVLGGGLALKAPIVLKEELWFSIYGIQRVPGLPITVPASSLPQGAFDAAGAAWDGANAAVNQAKRKP